MENEESSYLSILRSKLNQESIKFWLPPYIDETGGMKDFPLDLVSRYSKELSIPAHLVIKIFNKLRNHAIAKLKSREHFKSTGIATLFLHVIWTEAVNKKNRTDEIIHISLKDKSKDIWSKLAEVLEHPEHFNDSPRMIFKGKTLNPEISLEEQKVMNSSNIMVLLTPKVMTTMKTSDGMSTVQTQNKDGVVSDITRQTRQVAEKLAKRKDGGSGKNDRFYLELNDQHGNKISLPDDERESLCLAMTLHEKGRVLMKDNQISESLWLFLEADHEFTNCRAEILQSVDNYAVLNLDIVWCYFQLQQLESLPSAEQRLKECKECFARSYGTNLERLTLSKGSELNELALYVRLHILQAICFYLRGQNQQSSRSLSEAETLLKRLHVDDDKFSQMVSMGFTPKESRLSLRACRGDVTMSIEFISRRREEKCVRQDRERKEKKNRKESRKYKKTANNQLVDVGSLKNLQDMGFEHKLALTALQLCNNDMEKSLEILQNNPEVLYQALCSDDVPESLVQQFIAMGFSRSLVERTLRECNCDVDKCMTSLLSAKEYQEGASSNPTESSSSTSSNPTESSSSTSSNPTESSSSTSDSNKSESSDGDDFDAEIQETLGDISHEDLDDEYLNISLDEETELINKYRILIATTSHPQ